MKQLLTLDCNGAGTTVPAGATATLTSYAHRRCRPKRLSDWPAGFYDLDDTWIGSSRVALGDEGAIEAHPDRPPGMGQWRHPVLEAGMGFRVEVTNTSDTARVFVATLWGDEL